MGKMFMAASNYLPAQVSDMMNQDRAFATGRLNFSGQKNICTLSTYVRRAPPTLNAATHSCPQSTNSPNTRTENNNNNKKKREEGQEEG